MTCEHGKAAVPEELGAVSGVQSVAVAPESALVEVSGPSLEDASLRAAIDEAGYAAE